MMKINEKNGNLPLNNIKSYGVWEKFTGQKIYLTDLVWFKKNRLAFVDSSLTTGEPDRFTSIPEAWSFGSVGMNRRTAGKMGYAHVKKNGWVYRDEDWLSDRVDKLKWDKITHIMRINNPINIDDDK